jgi:hypothetical protein
MASLDATHQAPAASIASFSHNRQRRQSDSTVKLSAKTFRQRASSIIFTGPRAGDSEKGPSERVTGAGGEAAESGSTRTNRRQSVLQTMRSGLLGVPHDASEPHVPSVVTLLLSDVASGLGIRDSGKKGIKEDLMRRASRFKTMQPIDNLEDSPIDSSSDSSSSDEDNFVGVGGSRRMSAPGMLWQSIKRRASFFSANPSLSTNVGKVTSSLGDDVSKGAGVGGGGGGDIEAPSDASPPASASGRRRSVIATGGRKGSVAAPAAGGAAAGAGAVSGRRGSVKSASRRRSVAAAASSGAQSAQSSRASEPKEDIGAYKVDDGDALFGEAAPLVSQEEHQRLEEDQRQY